MTRDEVVDLWTSNRISLGCCDPEKYIFKNGYVFIIAGPIGLDKRDYLMREINGDFVSTSIQFCSEPTRIVPKTLYGFQLVSDAIKFKLRWVGM